LNATSSLEDKNVLPAPDYDEYLKQWAAMYEGKNYNSGLSGYFLQKSHKWAESDWNEQKHFSQVLEVGAGTGIHINYVNHSFDKYIMTDLNPPLMDQILLNNTKHGDKISTSVEDATKLSYADNSFDRVIAAHVLEHLPKPHEVLQEWARVLKPGGVLTLVLPCDPGVLWRIGRYAFARQNFLNAGIQYDYWMAREHVNPINNLVSFTRHFFPQVKEKWLPFGIKSIDANLFYIAHITV